MSVSVTDSSLDATCERLRQERETLNLQRQGLLETVQKKAQSHLDTRMREAKTRLENLQDQRREIQAERQKVIERVQELRPYAGILQAELERFRRAQSTSSQFASLRVTHCPVCDQEANRASDDNTCFLCHRPYAGGNNIAGNRRVEFETAQLQEEKGEIDELIQSLTSRLAELDSRYAEVQTEENRVEADLRPARQVALTLLPPDLTILDQLQGRINEQLETLQRVRKSLDQQKALSAEVHQLEEEELRLKVELDANKAELDFDELSRVFEDAMNDYLNAINVGDVGRWQHGRVTFNMNPRGFTLKADEKLGATSQAILLFAYHYALLSLVAHDRFYYPGLVIIDFPLQLADRVMIRDQENYLMQPFIGLCAKPGMEDTQVIAAGHSFEKLKGANVITIRRPQDA